jgi:hypothetical protein
MFPIVDFYVGKILRIVGSQIETEKIFSLITILTSFKRCLQSKKIDKLVFVNKNWFTDPRIGYKSPSSLVKLIEINVILKEELEEFKIIFERDEVMEFEIKNLKKLQLTNFHLFLAIFKV